MAAPDAGRRRFLRLDGVFYYGDVYLDGEYLGATEGYFAPQAFEVTSQLRSRDEHVLSVEVACPPQRDRTAKRTITGVFGQWDMIDPEFNPGGIWQPVRVTDHGRVRLSRARVLCAEASVERGRLACDVTLDADDGPIDARLRAVVTGPGGVILSDTTRDETLAAGENHLAWMLVVDGPPRWWPRTLGPQLVCTVELTVEVDGEPSDAHTVTTAFREVRVNGWKFSVNGERLFLKGSNYGPARMALGEADDELVRGDVQRAIDANLDFLRVHAHVAPRALYEAADATGLLLWQDLPLQWGYARSVRRQAVRQARAMVDLLGHHPSVFTWCAHNAPFAVDAEPGALPHGVARVKLAATAFLPTWGKDVLDRSIARALAKADPTRPVDRYSGVPPGLASAGTDAHLYFGWYHGDLAGLAPALRKLPRLGRFVSELGAQAVPTTAEWMEPERWPDLDWERLAGRHGLQNEVFARRVPAADAKAFDEWRDATQAYQAALLQLQIEDLRRLKYAPTGGLAQFAFADAYPAVSWSVLDHDRVAKRGYAALRDACRPALPMVEPREGLVHVVNDLREPLAGAIVEVEVDGRVTRWTGDVDADSVQYVGRVALAGRGRRRGRPAPHHHRHGRESLPVAHPRRLPPPVPLIPSTPIRPAPRVGA